MKRSFRSSGKLRFIARASFKNCSSIVKTIGPAYVAIEIVLVQGVQPLDHDDADFSCEVRAANDLNPEVLVRLRAMKFAQSDGGRSVELFDYGLHDVLLVNNGLLRVDERDGKE